MNLAEDEILSEVLMVDHILRLATYVFEVAIYSFNNSLTIEELLIELQGSWLLHFAGELFSCRNGRVPNIAIIHMAAAFATFRMRTLAP